MVELAHSGIIIDTNVIIDYLRRHSDLAITIATKFQAYTTVITVYEIEVAFLKSDRQLNAFNGILQNLTILSLDSDAASQAALVNKSLQTKNQIIALPDTLIAGICLSNNLPLLTRNLRHFQRVANLQTISPDDIDIGN